MAKPIVASKLLLYLLRVCNEVPVFFKYIYAGLFSEDTWLS
mgnify:CR=1 FL=1